MFDIGFPELLLVSVVMLLVFGPERLPEVLRNVGRFVGGARRSFDALRSELEREVGADEIRRELHNARILEEAKKLDSMVRAGRDEVEEMLGERYAALKDDGRIDAVPGEGNDEAQATADGDAAPAAEAPSPAHRDRSSGVQDEPKPETDPSAGPAASPVEDPEVSRRS